jgi:hypothetical protein
MGTTESRRDCSATTAATRSSHCWWENLQMEREHLPARLSKRAETCARVPVTLAELDDVLDDAESEFALNKTLIAFPEPRRGEAIVDEGGRGMASSELREIA